METHSFVLLSGLVTFVIFVVLLILADHFLKPSKDDPDKPEKLKNCEKRFILIRILCNEQGHYSLSLFQFLLWTLVISFIVMLLSLIRIFSGELEVFPFNEFPTSLLLLMGMSVVVPLVKTGIDDVRKSKSDENVNTSASMIQYKGSSSLTRFQMLIWTIISIIIYIFVVVMELSQYSANPDPSKLIIPPVDPILISLMGLSQVGFIGGAIVAEGQTPKRRDESEEKIPSGTEGEIVTTAPQITSISALKGKPGDIVTIYGNGFGKTKGNVFFNGKPLDSTAIRYWEKTIEIKIPELSEGEYDIYVATDKPSNIKGFTIQPEIPELRSRFEKVKIKDSLWEGALDARHLNLWENKKEARTKKPLHFFYEYEVPPGRGEWGGAFEVKFYIDGKPTSQELMLPRAFPEGNIGCFTYIFKEPGEYEIEIKSQNSVKRKITIYPYEMNDE